LSDSGSGMGMEPKGVAFWTCPILQLSQSPVVAKGVYLVLRAGGDEWPRRRKSEGQCDGDCGAIEVSEFSLCRERWQAMTKAYITWVKVFRNTNHGAMTWTG